MRHRAQESIPQSADYETPMVMDRVESTADALRFYRQANSQLSQALYGEQIAKDEAISSLADRKPLIASGLPGGGKSVLAEILPKLVLDINDEDIALISGQHDLTANQLVGGEVGSTKRITDLRTNESHAQYTGTTIEGAIRENTKYVHIAEGNRLNPFALNSLLSVTESGRIESSAGEIELEDLVAIFLDMNPSDISQSTFEMSHAMASRLAHGVQMGVKGGREERKRYSRAVREINRRREELLGPNSRPRDMVHPVVTLAGLTGLRAYVLRTEIDGKTEDKIDDIAINVADKLAEMNVAEETDGRIGQQIAQNARTLGGLKNKEHVVSGTDVRDSTRSVVVARMGALQRTDHHDIEKIVNEVTGF